MQRTPLSVLDNRAVTLPHPLPHGVRGIELVVVSSIFLALAVLAVGARLYRRIYIRRWLGADDALISIALFFTIGVHVGFIIGNVKFAWNRHIWDVPLPLFTPAKKTVFATRIFWGLASPAVRLSVLCLYYRLLNHAKGRQYRWILHCMTGFTIAMMMVFVFGAIFACVPPYYYWTFAHRRDPKCTDEAIFVMIVVALNTLSEFIAGALPILAVFKLGVSRQQRRTVIVLLSLGTLVSTVGCVRLYYVSRIFGSNDFTWWYCPSWVCAQIEIDVALICACVPSLSPVLSRLFNSKPAPAPTWLCPQGPDGGEAKRPESLDPPGGMLTVDIEGICNDGLGYTVMISGPKKCPPLKDWANQIQRRWHRARNDTQPQAHEKQVSQCTEASSSSALSASSASAAAAAKEPTAPTATRVTATEVDGRTSLHKKTGSAFEITARRSLDIKESFREDKRTCGKWADFWTSAHNKAVRRSQNDDDEREMGISQAAMMLPDWSLLDCDAAPGQSSLSIRAESERDLVERGLAADDESTKAKSAVLHEPGEAPRVATPPVAYRPS